MKRELLKNFFHYKAAVEIWRVSIQATNILNYFKMKRFYTLALSLLMLLIASTQVSANKVYVKGTVKFNNGTVAVNWPVLVSTDSTTTIAGCKQSHTVYTNANGYYVDTLNCTGSDIVKVRISTKDCNSAYLSHDPQVTPNNVVESNFIICTPAVVHCEAAFNFKRAEHSLIVQFSSSESQSTGTADKIIRRRWKFSDGDIIGGNIVDPSHTFKQRGSYQTCLTIWTAAGCENTVCKTINITDSTPVPPSTGCEAGFNFTREANSMLVKYNSGNAHGASSTDKIVRRRWKFADGDTLGGNIVDPAHTYAKGGTYSTCLTIWTSAGCENTVCKTVNIESTPPPPVVHCAAKYVFETVPSANIAGVYVKFNSNPSSVATGDSIRERIWKFGDGTTGNTIDPAHFYTKGGNYNVCLIIRSVKGCSDSICTNIQLPVTTPPACHANFTFASDGATIKFNSSISTGDSIVSRQWLFGDSSAIGTTTDPVHKYTKSGVYTVCLYIKTARGCESKECKQVTVTVSATTATPVPPAATKCQAVFSYEILSIHKIRFNSTKSNTLAGDSIVERKWNFGDGSAIPGHNEISPAKEFNRPGVYTVCLQIRTKGGCESKYCTTVRIADNSSVPPINEYIKIVSLHPNPVVTPLSTEVWSHFSNITAELSIYDIYGVKKWSISKVLLQGTNVTSIPTGFLLPGPYFFRVTTMYGVKSAAFYKL